MFGVRILSVLSDTIIVEHLVTKSRCPYMSPLEAMLFHKIAFSGETLASSRLEADMETFYNGWLRQLQAFRNAPLENT